MTVLVFILVWVVLGAGLVFLAMTGGPRGARRQVHSQSRTGRRVATGLLLVSFIAFGIAIPALVVGRVEARDTVDNSGIELSEAAKRGRVIFGQRCRNCHALEAANARGKVGPNLDDLLGSNPEPEALIRAALDNGKAEGQGQMPSNIVEGSEEDAVIAFLVESAGKVSPDDTSR